MGWVSEEVRNSSMSSQKHLSCNKVSSDESCDPVVLQCTCLAVSRKWLALGTSAGGLHLIQREGWKQRLILTHKVISDSMHVAEHCSANTVFFHVNNSVTRRGLFCLFVLQEGSITQVACCPHDEDFIAVATRLEMKSRNVSYSSKFKENSPMI